MGCVSRSMESVATALAQKIALLKKQFDQIEKLVSAECVNWQIGDLQTEHRRVFTNVITLDCPPYETLFGNDHVFAQSHVMGDIAGFYKAFGVELSKDVHERSGSPECRARVHAFSDVQRVLFALP
jgi:hypothetical protein